MGIFQNAAKDLGVVNELVNGFLATFSTIVALTVISMGGWDYSMEKSLRDLVAKILGIALALMMGIGGVWSSISSGLAWGRAWRSVFICTFSVIGFTAISIARKATGQKKYE